MVHRYGAEYDFYIAVRPGVLGLWQVSGRNKLTYPERIKLDAPPKKRPRIQLK